jgi:hypothetical protein
MLESVIELRLRFGEGVILNEFFELRPPFAGEQ